MNIAGREIGAGQEPYIVADISASHNGDVERGRKLIRLAKLAGADAVKFQAYLPELVSSSAKREEFIIKDGPWAGRTLYDLYTQAHTPRAHLAEYFAYSRQIGITAFATACSKEDVDFLGGLGNPAIKIASMDIVNLPLIEYASRAGKPLILSTGMASFQELDDVSDLLLRSAVERPVWLHCISNYNPCPLEQTLIVRVAALDLSLCGDVGFSDHTLGYDAAIMAVALGACMVEKHLTIGRCDGGPDDHFASEPREFLALTQKVRSAYQAMQPAASPGEEAHRPLRPSLRAVKPIAFDEIFTEQNVRAIRPGGGLPPKELPNVLGRPAARDIEEGEAIGTMEVG